MLGSAESTNELQLQDVMSSHIIPLLRLPDIQSLGQTCTQLQELIKSGLPQSAWRHAAAKTVRPGQTQHCA